MTFEECSKLRNEIAARVADIVKKREEEWIVDELTIKDLRSYCRRIYPRFIGRYGNFGSKVAEMADAAMRALTDGDVHHLTRAINGIDIALLLHEKQGRERMDRATPLISETKDRSKILRLLIDAVHMTAKGEKEPEFLIRGIEYNDVIKVAKLLPADYLRPEDQTLVDEILGAAPRTYFAAGLRLAYKAKGIGG